MQRERPITCRSCFGIEPLLPLGKILDRIKGLFHPYPEKKREIFLISDLHLNHARIIRYCNRPYRGVGQMNRDLVERWNSVVGPEDIVYHLGDFSFRGNPRDFIRQLSGRKRFIRGNHDRGLLRAKRCTRLAYRGYEFFMAHHPASAPGNWKGWVIHGHTHNKITEYPFINGEKRTINVSCECTGYAPVSLDFLVSLDLDSILRMDTVHSMPQRKGQWPDTGGSGGS